MQDFEKLGLFYLGRAYDAAARRPLDDLVLYDSRDLVTHAVCVGMTGSGKTGLCLSLIEEAAIDGVPVIAIDPKGDLGNLLLTFPGLSATEFRPWIDEDEARRAGVTPDAFAAAEAERWTKGLAEWGQDAARIERLRSAAEFAIYTPGSSAGLPVSIMSSFAAPSRRTGAGAEAEGEAQAERASTTAISVLALAGIDAQPRSREHTLLAMLLTAAWSAGASLDLPSLIQQVQSPPFQKVGVLDLETFFPAKDRFELAMRLNGVLAAPGFAQWMEGAPLDPSTLLYTAQGRPRVAIFSIAHLGDAERMFFVTLLLNQVVAWMRAQTGTTSLRAIIYMDEILGYFPPVANPPSKPPLLTLLKQGRAFGIGVLLATQNPVDLDYKGLANTGTWFLGRLQTERDKARMLDGLEGAAAGAMNREDTDRLLSSLDKRVFLLHNVHEKGPVVFQTRWTLSYLRGPLSRDQIRALRPQWVPEVPGVPEVRGSQVRGSAADRQAGESAPPVLPPGVQQFFVPARHAGSAVRYTPVVIGAARVGFGDSKLGIDEVRDVVYAARFGDRAVPVDWVRAERVDLTAADLQSEGSAGAAFGHVPPPGLQAKNYATWGKDLGKWLAQSEKLELFRQADLKLTSRLGESERDFTIRVNDALRLARDAAVDALRKKFEPRRARLAEQLRRAEAAVERESSQASQQKLQTGLSIGTTILGALFGRKTISAGTLGRATTAARGVGRSMKESEDIRRAAESVDRIRAEVRALEEELLAETRKISENTAPPVIDRIALTPKRGQVSVQLVGLGWMPDE